ncbi:MAG: molybdopterin-dependent oxidoreductase [Gammaproteobacteria bacterium]|nr:molybdopterin-dependent oxidoreductase [Gammaproteobacteria bacterium]
MAWNYPRLTRRTFLKTAGFTAAGLGLLKPITLLSKDQKKVGSGPTEETSYGICNFCSSLCNLKITTRTNNGIKRVVKLDGNPYSTLNRGKLCARGQSGLRQTYDTDRLKTPLIRVEGSKRGEFKFRAASWDEAWAYIDKKAKGAEIKPWEWTMVGGWTSCIFYMNWAVPFAMANEVPNIVASPMQHCVTTGHLGTDMVTGNFNIHDEVLPDYDNARYILFVANNASIGGVSTSRMVRFAEGRKRGAKVVALDTRLSETAAKADEWIAIRPGTDLDFMLAMLREMMAEGFYDSEFLRTHSNLPFLAYRDEKGDWQLANDSEGHPQAVAEGGSTTVHALPAFSNSNTQDVNGDSFYPALQAPEGLEVDGKPVVTVFQAQLEELKEYTPEWAAETTGIPSETIRRIAREFGTSRPSVVDPGWHGARYGNIMMLRRVQAMIQALNGGIDKEGGWIMSGEFHHKVANMWKAKAEGHASGPPLATLAGMPFAKMVVGAVSNGKNFSHGRPGWAWSYSAQEKAGGRPHVALPVMADTGYKESVEGKVMHDGEPYRSRAVIINAANPVRHYYPDTYWKEILTHENMELVVAIDVLPSDTTAYADVILPNSTYLERDEPTLYGNGVNHDLALVTRHAPIDSMYDTDESPDILLRFTDIVSGNRDKFLMWMENLTGLPAKKVKAAYAEIGPTMKNGGFSAACRKVAFSEAALRLGTTPEKIDTTLREKGVYKEEDKDHMLEHFAMPRKLPLPSESGRLEFYSPFLQGLYNSGETAPNFSPLATHIPATCRTDKSMKAPLAADEFYFTYGKTPTVSYASTNNNNPVLAAINTFKKDIYTGIWIHPDRAESLGIGNGDAIRLKNNISGQEADGTAYVTRKVHRDALFLYSSFGVENRALSRSYGIGTATNKLIPYQVEPVVAGFRSQEFTIQVTKLNEKGGVA